MTKSEEINQVDRTDKTPLMILASQGNVEMIDLFVLNNATLTQVNRANETVLHHANEAGMKKLLGYHDAPVNHVSKDGRTALHHAIQIKSAVSAKLLLQHGARILPFSEDIPNEIQYAIHTGVSQKSYSVLKAILPYLDKESLRAAYNEAYSTNSVEYKKVSTMILKVYRLKFHTTIV
jgi:hypothetical protein